MSVEKNSKWTLPQSVGDFSPTVSVTDGSSRRKPVQIHMDELVTRVSGRTHCLLAMVLVTLLTSLCPTSPVPSHGKSTHCFG